MTRHTQEPWRYRTVPHPEVANHIGFEVTADTVHGEAIVVTMHSSPRLSIVDEDTIRRIVACVNACAGIPTDRLEAGALAEALSTLAPRNSLRATYDQ